jgi:hypothetical protein
MGGKVKCLRSGAMRAGNDDPRGELPQTTIFACSKCNAGVDTVRDRSVCPECGHNAMATEFAYGDPNRCDLRTKGPDAWGCHKRKGHDTGNGGRWCSTHDDCGFKLPDGAICSLRPGHNNNLHE